MATPKARKKRLDEQGGGIVGAVEEARRQRRSCPSSSSICHLTVMGRGGHQIVGEIGVWKEGVGCHVVGRRGVRGGQVGLGATGSTSGRVGVSPGVAAEEGIIARGAG